MSEQNETARGEWYSVGNSALLRNLKGQCIGRYDCADESTAKTLAANLEVLEQALAQERQQREQLGAELSRLTEKDEQRDHSVHELQDRLAMSETGLVLQERQQREAAEAERDAWRNTARAMRSAADLAANSLHMDGSNYVRGINRIRDIWVEAKQGYAIEDPLQSYAAKLLALAEEQRRALQELAKKLKLPSSRALIQDALACHATDLDALVAEARELGVEAARD